jgi:pimeloyl-ACP methyl ester carboxylesterase
MALNHDPIRAGSSLTRLEGGWLAAGDIARRVVVVVHGFTSDASYMRALADYLERSGSTVALFEYDSYLGIDYAAALLEEKLRPLHAMLDRHGFVIVAHSMGGLVARVVARTASTSTKGLRGIVLLGTPNDGTLRGPMKRLFMSYLLDWSDALTVPNPFSRSAICLSALQLTCSDDTSLVDNLNSDDRKDPHGIPMLSISGGLEFLEMGKSSSTSMLASVRNAVLQGLINNSPNDGLVPETSSNVASVLSGPGMMHRNDYAEYPTTNHTYLDQNQSVAQIIVEWIDTIT